MADREHHQQQHHLQQQHQPHHAGHYQPGQHQQFHPTDAIKNLLPEKGPSTSQVLAVVTLFPIGGILLTLAGLTLAGTVIGLAVATPLFIIFSPVLVPAALTIGLAVTGFLASGAFGVTGLSSMSWIFNYVRELINPEQARSKIQEAAQKTKEYGQQIQSKAHEVGQKPEGARDQAARKPI